MEHIDEILTNYAVFWVEMMEGKKFALPTTDDSDRCGGDVGQPKDFSINDEKRRWLAFAEFLRQPLAHFARNHSATENPVGHFTGSTLITDTNFERVLLTHHRKLNKWLQLGGHADGDQNILRVAMREAHEESGLNQLTFVPLASALPAALFKEEHPFDEKTILPLDIDCHEIPARSGEAMHYHYDVNFLVVAEDSRFVCSDESHALAWFDIEQAREKSSDLSVHRQLSKLVWLKEQIQHVDTQASRLTL